MKPCNCICPRRLQHRRGMEICESSLMPQTSLLKCVQTYYYKVWLSPTISCTALTKGHIGIYPFGAVTFVSNLWDGSVSDVELTMEVWVAWATSSWTQCYGWQGVQHWICIEIVWPYTQHTSFYVEWQAVTTWCQAHIGCYKTLDTCGMSDWMNQEL